MSRRSPSFSAADILASARTTLRVSTSLCPLIPAPIIGTILATVQVIIDEAEKVRTNKQSAAELAKFAAGVVDDITKVVSRQSNLVNQELVNTLALLQQDLEETRNTMRAHTTLRLYQRVIRRGTLADELSEYKDKIEFSLRKFMMNSAINMQIQLQKLENEVVTTRNLVNEDRRFDARNVYRVYREGEVDKIRYCYSIKRKMRYDTLETPSMAAEIDVYDAEVEGRVRTVHYYRDTKALHRTVNALDRLRKSPHPNFAQIEGCSPENSDSQFLVLKGSASQLSPADPLIRNMPVEECFTECLRLMRSIFAATAYLHENGLKVEHVTQYTIYVNSYNQVILGSHDDIVELESEHDMTHICIPSAAIMWERWGFQFTVEDKTKAIEAYEKACLDRFHRDVTTNRGNASLSTLLRRYFSFMELSRDAHSHGGVGLDADLAELVDESHSCTHGPPVHLDKGFVRPPRVPHEDMMLGIFQIAFLGPERMHSSFILHFSFPQDRIKRCGVIWSTTSCHCAGKKSFVQFHDTSSTVQVIPNATLVQAVLCHHLDVITRPQEMHFKYFRDPEYVAFFKTLLTVYRHSLKGQSKCSLYQLFLAHSVSQAVVGKVDKCPDGITLYFHINPLNENGFFPKPWGYFSIDPKPYENPDVIPCTEVYEDTGCKYSDKRFYKCTIPGVDALVVQDMKLDCWKLNEEESSIVSFLDTCSSGVSQEELDWVERHLDKYRNPDHNPATCSFARHHPRLFYHYEGRKCLEVECKPWFKLY